MAEKQYMDGAVKVNWWVFSLGVFLLLARLSFALGIGAIFSVAWEAFALMLLLEVHVGVRLTT